MIRLDRLRRLARASLWAERAWVALAPAAGVVVGALAVGLLGLPQRLPPLIHAGVLASVLGAVAALAWRGARRIAAPTAAEVDRRLEQAAGLAHRPLSVLADRPAGLGDATLWRAHRRAAERSVATLRWPPPRLAARDPFALQGLLVVGLAASLIIAGTDAPGRLADALWPHLPGAAPVSPPTVTAWATPPGYTGLPPLALPPSTLPADNTVSLPEGSVVELAVAGAPSAPAILPPQPVTALDAGSYHATVHPAADGPLTVAIAGRTVARWTLRMRADVAPVVAWTQPPAVAPGRTPGVRLGYTATHAYGVVALSAELRLRDRPDAPPLIVALPMAGPPRAIKGTRTEDLTAHPWAGLPVAIRLSAGDGAGRTGVSQTLSLLLPERAFSQPMARALIDARRALVLGQPADIAEQLDALADDTPAWAGVPTGPAQLRALATGLRAAPALMEPAQGALWALALQLEEGGPARTAMALRQAQDALREALARHAPQMEVERRARALSEALEGHAQALAEARRRDPASARADPKPARDTLQRLRDANRAGQPDAAQADMAELDRALSEMRAQSRDPAARERVRQAQARAKGRRNQSVIGDLLRREQGLLDHTQARAATIDPPPGSLNLPPGGLNDTYRDPPIAAHDADPSARAADGAMQGALRRVLGEMMSIHGELTGRVPPELGVADQAMRDAGASLRASQDAGAADDMARVIKALQQGSRSMRESMRRQFGPPRAGNGQGDGQGEGREGSDPGPEGQDGQTAQGDGDGSGDGLAQTETDGGDDPGGDPGANPRGGRDPFGRPLGATDGAGTRYGDGRETKVPGADPGGRARAVQEELRRRGADPARPPAERDYIGRLLGPG